MTELSQALGETTGRLESERRLREQLQTDLQRTEQGIQEARHGIRELQSEQDRITTEMARELPDHDNQMQEQLTTLGQSAAELTERRDSGRNALAELSEKVHEARQALDGVRENLSQSQLARQKVELELGHLLEQVEENYGGDIFGRAAPNAPRALRGDGIAGRGASVSFGRPSID